MKLDPANFKLTPLPVYSPCYCNQCKQPLASAGLVEDNLAWCPDCKQLVITSYFQVPAWVVGVVVLLCSELLLLK